MHTFRVDAAQAGERVDVLAAEVAGVSRASMQAHIRGGGVLVDGKKVRASLSLREGQEVEILPFQEKVVEAPILDDIVSVVDTPEIILETEQFLVVNKPAHMLTHPTEAGESNTLADFVVEHDPRIAFVGESADRPGIVHRLDREASGLLVIAKTQEMFLALKKQFADRSIVKEYVVLVHGNVPREHEIIDFAIDRGRDGTMVARPKTDPLSLKGVRGEQPGKNALTEYDVLERFARFTLLRVRIHTGRMHQIRVHMFAYNHPVFGDTIYMNKKLNTKKDALLGRLFLHAAHLSFTDLSGNLVDVSCKLPQSLQNVLLTLR